MNVDAVDEIVRFWFKELSPEDWYKADEKRDAEIRRRFNPLYEKLRAGVPQHWLEELKGWLAAILVFDQFPRNMFRGDPRAFATDAQALALVKQAIVKGVDMRLPPDQRASSICHSSIRKMGPIRRARSSCSRRSATRTISTLRSGTKPLSTVSGASPTATPCSDGRRQKTSQFF